MLWLKRLIRHGIAVFVYYSGLLRLWVTLRDLGPRGPQCPILMYHRVVDASDFASRYSQPGITVTPQTFKQQIAFFADKYRIISLGRLVDALRSGKRPLPRSVVVTFDDGWQDNYEYALPVLKAYGATATIFLCTDLVGSRDSFWFLKFGMLVEHHPEAQRLVAEVLASSDWTSDVQVPIRFSAGHAEDGGTLDTMLEQLKDLDGTYLEELADRVLEKAGIAPGISQARRWVLNWDEVREMRDVGIDFGAHGRTHRILTRLSDVTVETEVRGSREALEKELGGCVAHFAYPNGDYDAAVQEHVKRAGYLAAVATRPAIKTVQHLDDPELFALPRVNIHEGVSLGWTGKFSRAMFACAVHRVFPFR